MNRSVARIGLFYGLLRAGISVFTVALVLGVSHILWAQILSGMVNVLASIVLFALAGYMAVRQTGSIRDGALAGLIAALVDGVIGLLLIGVQYLVDPSSFSSMQSSVTHSSLPSFAVIASLVTGGLWGVALALAFGAGLGALGGWLGPRDTPLHLRSARKCLVWGEFALELEQLE